MDEKTAEPALPSEVAPRRGIGFAALVVLALLACVLVAVFAIRHQRGVVRSNVAKTKADMRALATAIETYYLDNMLYPAMTIERSLTPDASRYPADMRVGRTFRMKGNNALSTITTPVAYIEGYAVDPFAENGALTYRYHTDRSGFILGSYGPDSDAMEGGQLEWDCGDVYIVRQRIDEHDYVRPVDPVPDAAVEYVYDSRWPQPSNELLGGAATRGAYTYDPTNGLVSPGDVWRTKD